jgi:hypothetical protein
MRLEAENAVLRHQLIVLRRRPHGRVQLSNHDRWLFVQLYRWFPSILKALMIVRPETLLRWHRAGFRLYEAPRVKRLFRDQTFLTSFLPFKRLRGSRERKSALMARTAPLLGRDERSTPGARRVAPEGARG